MRNVIGEDDEQVFGFKDEAFVGVEQVLIPRFDADDLDGVLAGEGDCWRSRNCFPANLWGRR